MKRYALFIGRWRTFHSGHLWLVKQQLDLGNPVWLAIRPTDEEPSVDVRFKQIREVMKAEGYRYQEDYVISYLPFDLESVNYGRGVGYNIVAWTPPEDVCRVSATEILDG